MDELKKKLEELARAFEEFKTINDQRIREIATKGAASADTEAKLQKANADIDRLTQDRDRLQKEIDAVKTALNRPGQGDRGNPDADAEQKAKDEAYRKLFLRALRKGHRNFSEAELKTLMSTDSDADGGYLVPVQRESEVVKKVFESSPIAELAEIITLGQADSVEFLQDLDEPEAGWVGEQESRDETDTPQLDMVTIHAHEIYAMPKVTQRMLDDTGFDVEGWLQQKLVEKFGRIAATAFCSGNGIKKPMGFLSYAAGTGFNQIEQVNSGHATTVTADGLIALQGALKEPYQANATFLMKRATVTNVRKLKDGNNNYLWQPSIQAGVPDMLLGRPVRLADDMPAEAASALSVAYGDFRQGYAIVRKLGVRTLRDALTSKGFVKFYTTIRIGGGVKNFEAIKLGKCSA